MPGWLTPKNNLTAVALTALAQLTSAPAAARIDLTESRPGRPLVLADGETDLGGSLGLLLVTSPETDLADMVLLPLRGAVGLGGRWEGALAVDLALRPSFTLALTPRGRVRLDKRGRLALGLAVTLPLGYLWHRIGPEGLPVHLELPVLRLENSHAMLQAGLNISYALREGPDAKGLLLDAAGVVRIAGSAFAVMDLDLGLPEFEPDEAAVGLGLGLGMRVTQRIMSKLQVFTKDLTTLETWEIWLTVCTVLELKEKTADDWL